MVHLTAGQVASVSSDHVNCGSSSVEGNPLVGDQVVCRACRYRAFASIWTSHGLPFQVGTSVDCLTRAHLTSHIWGFQKCVFHTFCAKIL